MPQGAPPAVGSQSDGKVTGMKDATPAEVEALAKASPNAAPLLEGKTIKKVVVMPGRMVNIVTG
jgi:leucyl-tRNA synthetase